ncbi:MAG: Lrp/AsnC ligand binding domain-containing protein [Deltaproteobacteria bacterium]|nr:Lrp/AsnC ligand binding domain-containing protein [Deltaproteobacteria bacterium]
MISGWLGKTGQDHRCRAKSEVKSFKEDQEKEAAFDAMDLGVRLVPLERIVGSVGRYHDFDSKFRLKDHLPQERLELIKKTMKEGKPLPPVQLYQIKDEYYVLDGNHRVAAAKELGYSQIHAHIVEFIPSKDTLEGILYRERADFKAQTGLSDKIDLTEIGKYPYLLQQISRHRQHLEQESGGKTPVSLETAAEDWYKTIYRPLTAIIQRGRLLESFPNRTLADLYTYISSHQWERMSTRRYGRGIDPLICKDMEEFREKMSQKREAEYPEMLRKITAFVLMHVSAKKEDRIIEKLYSLEEVQEIHSVHGDVDLLIKIVLTRDLVSSDAEIIGDFVHNQIRQLPGVISTQTLIPGFSKIKNIPAGDSG